MQLVSTGPLFAAQETRKRGERGFRKKTPSPSGRFIRTESHLQLECLVIFWGPGVAFALGAVLPPLVAQTGPQNADLHEGAEGGAGRPDKVLDGYNCT